MAPRLMHKGMIIIPGIFPESQSPSLKFGRGIFMPVSIRRKGMPLQESAEFVLMLMGILLVFMGTHVVQSGPRNTLKAGMAKAAVSMAIPATGAFLAWHGFRRIIS